MSKAYDDGLAQLWLADARDMSFLEDGSVGLIITDPPYNMGKDYGPEVNDSKPLSEYLAWYREVADECYRVLAGGYIYVSCAVEQVGLLRPIWERAGFTWVMPCIWWGPNYAARTNVIIREWGLLYEPIMMLRKGPRLKMLNDTPGTNSDAVMRHTRPQRQYLGSLHRVHPTQKPISLYWNIVGRTPGEPILDPFCGSASVNIAATKLGRRSIGVDCVEEYIALAIKRLGGPFTVEVGGVKVRQEGLFQ